jgi:flagellar hook-associated protein 2
MAINSTSSATSAAAAPTTGPGKGSVIDVAGLVSKLDSIEQVPIDRLGVKVTKQDNAIRDLGIIKERMSIFQAALQDFTDPISYLNKTVSSSNPTVVSTSVSNSSSVSAGVFNVNVTQLAKTSTAMYAFTIPGPGITGNFDLGDSLDNLESFSFNENDTLETIKNKINLETSNTNVRAAVVNTGNQFVLSLTSTVGGANSNIFLDQTPTTPSLISQLMKLADPSEPEGQDGADAIFSINGQTFTRSSNTVDDALAGVRLQLQGEGPVTIVAGSENREIAQTLITNVGQAYNDLMASYTELSKFNADPEKRGSLYGFMELRGMMDSISMSFMSPLTRSSGSNSSSAPINDTGGNPISFTTLGLELQLDGTLLFKSAAFESAVTRGALEQLANGSLSSTRTIVNDAMTFGGKVDSFIDGFEDERSTLQNRITDLENRKAEKMARYQAQYASLDALLFRLQALNNSLTPTFEALNNPKN